MDVTNKKEHDTIKNYKLQAVAYKKRVFSLFFKTY